MSWNESDVTASVVVVVVVDLLTTPDVIHFIFARGGNEKVAETLYIFVCLFIFPFRMLFDRLTDFATRGMSFRRSRC